MLSKCLQNDGCQKGSSNRQCSNSNGSWSTTSFSRGAARWSTACSIGTVVLLGFGSIFVSARRGSAQALSCNRIPPEWTAVIWQWGAVSSSTICNSRSRDGGSKTRRSSRAVEASGKIGSVEVAHVEKRTRYYTSCDIESLETIANLLGSNGLLALHVALVGHLGSRYWVLHPLKELVIGDEPDIRLGSKALNEVHNSRLLCSGIRQSRVICQMGRVDIDTKRLAVTVVMTIKISLRPGSNISRSTSKINVHELRNASIIEDSVHGDLPDAR